MQKWLAMLGKNLDIWIYVWMLEKRNSTNTKFITENTLVFSIIYMKSFSIRYSRLLVR